MACLVTLDSLMIYHISPCLTRTFIDFNSQEEARTEIPPETARDLIKETLNYANELERIV